MDREEKVRLLKLVNPDLTLSAIAGQIGMSRQGVWSLVKRIGLQYLFSRVKRKCKVCGKRLQKRPKTGKCRSCLRTAVFVQCPICRKIFRAYPSELARKRFPPMCCSKRCATIKRWKEGHFGTRKRRRSSQEKI